MKIKITYELNAVPVVDVDDYWGMSESAWNELEDDFKDYLVGGYVRLHLNVSYVKVDDTEST